RRRRAQAGMALTAFALLVTMAGAGWWIQRQQARQEQQEERTRLQAETVLTQLPQLYQRGFWRQAEESITQSLHALGADGDAALLQRLETARFNTRFLATLNGVRQGKMRLMDGMIDVRSASPKYQAAFAAHGFDVLAAPPAELVRKLN